MRHSRGTGRDPKFEYWLVARHNPGMPDIASVLKSEIARIARKEIRVEIDSVKKAVGTYRSEIAALKRRAQTLEQELKRVLKSAPNSPTPPASENDGSKKKMRFSAKGLAKQRQRLG